MMFYIRTLICEASAMPSSDQPAEPQQFIAALRSSLAQQEFVRLTLSGYRGEEAGLNSLVVQLVQLKAGLKLAFTYRYKTKEIVKNLPIDDAITQIANSIGNQFTNARIFTTQQDYQLTYNKRLEPRLVKAKPTFPTAAAPKAHDRQKQYFIQPANNIYLKALGITNAQGEIVRTREAKFKQINKFIEIIDSLYRNSDLPQRDRLSIVDMGSGKGYLTFAVYDFLNHTIGKPSNVTGIELREELVTFCNATAQQAEFNHLTFAPGTIQSAAQRPMDIAIALHACDTATDDAIHASIQARATIIVLAPCCHNQIRRQMNESAAVKATWGFGILIERQAQLVTDRLRSLWLELHGYQTKVFEFIDAEHTDKNLMITATKHDRTVNQTAILAQIAQLKMQNGIRSDYLADLFAGATPLQSTLEQLI
jgi:SAM-dependent methyltransferase